MRTFAQIPGSLLDVGEAQEGLVTAGQCDEHGVGSSRRTRLVRSGRWTAVTRGVFDTCPVRPTWPGSAAAAGCSSSRWTGFDWHDGSVRGAARDRYRDNDFARQGVDVLRFAAEHVRREVVGRDVARFLSSRRVSRS